MAWRLARRQGLAGLSLRELATEVGMRPQSLYSYFDSKHAIYDAMYAQGCRQFAAGQAALALTGDLTADILAIGRYFVGFCTEDPVRYQLMYQRTIPGFEPSAASYASPRRVSVASSPTWRHSASTTRATSTCSRRSAPAW